MKVRASSMAPAATNAAARVRPPSRNKAGDAAAAELGEGGVDAVGGGRAGGDQDLGARIPQRLEAGRVGVRGDDHEDRGDVEGREELGVEGEAGGGVEDDAERLARASCRGGR